MLIFSDATGEDRESNEDSKNAQNASEKDMACFCDVKNRHKN